MNSCNHRTLSTFPLLAAASLFTAMTATTPAARADSFGSGENAFEIEFVTVGDPGNPADTTGVPNPAGSVPYTYRIGKYEISEQMINKANAVSAEAGDPLGITIDERGPDKPATRASWFEAAKFVNWLNTSKGSTPAYKFDENGDFQLWEPGDAGYDSANLLRNTLATYFLPSADEWYKAAFYDPVTDVYFDFPTGSDDPPMAVASGTDPGTAAWNQATGPADVMLTGGESPFGTVSQAGNVWEWEETDLDLANDDPQAVRGLRGFHWGLAAADSNLSASFRNHSLPWRSLSNVGFRIASIPEPSTLWLVVTWLLVSIVFPSTDRRKS
jgi:sulfatase-modifying factor enzyme 1